MQPDLPAPLLPLAPLRQRAAALAALALLASLWLGWRHAGRAWWQRRHRPFASAARDIRGLLRSTDEAALDAAVRRLHSALNEDAGRVMLAADLPAWLAERPRYRVLEPALQQFHAHSSLRFFASTPRSAADVAAETQAIATLSQALARLERTP
jgi:mxaA protein